MLLFFHHVCAKASSQQPSCTRAFLTSMESSSVQRVFFFSPSVCTFFSHAFPEPSRSVNLWWNELNFGGRESYFNPPAILLDMNLLRWFLYCLWIFEVRVPIIHPITVSPNYLSFNRNWLFSRNSRVVDRSKNMERFEEYNRLWSGTSLVWKRILSRIAEINFSKITLPIKKKFKGVG